MSEPTYRLQLLGRFRLTSPSGEDIPLPAKKAQALLGILALAAGESVPRSRITDLLWGDRGEAQARSSLRQAFAALRKIFPDSGPPPLKISDEGAALDLDAVEVDVVTLQESRLDEATLAGAGKTFLEGLSLPEQSGQDWLESERRRLETLYQQALAEAMQRRLTAGDSPAAFAHAQRLLALDPYHEAAQRAVMQALSDKGERTKALQLYHDFQRRLADDLNTEPTPETKALYEILRAGPEAVPGAMPAASKDGRLPQGAQRLAVAVVPIESLSDSPELGYLADGITRELINALGRFSAHEVVSANTMSSYRGRSLSPQAIGRELAVDYVLEGNLQGTIDRLRVSAQVTAVATGRQIWGQRFDGSAQDPFAFQDQVVGQISGNLFHPLMKAAVQQARENRSKDPDIQNLYMRSFHHIEHPTAAGMSEALQACRQILDLNPEFPLVYEHLAWINLHSAYNGWTDDPWAAFEDAKRLCEQGIVHDDKDGYLRSALGLSEVYLGNYRRGLAELEKARQVNPYDAEYLAWLGIGLTVVGRLQEARAAFAEADRLSPGYPPIHLFRGDAAFADGDPRAALSDFDAFLAVLPEYNWALIGKAAAHVECDEVEAAAAAVERLRQQGPRLDGAYLKRLLRARQPAVIDRLLTALETAGLPMDGAADTADRAAESQPAARLDTPKVAVLPFVNMSGDATQDYFSDGLTEDIITELSRFRNLFVIARHSSFAFKNKPPDAAQAAADLGVRYVVEGSVRRAGERIRVTAQLIDADSGTGLWADRYDRDIEDVFAVQDEIARTIVASVWGKVEAADYRRAERLSPVGLKAYDLSLQGRALLAAGTKDEIGRAIEKLEAALALDPRNSGALCSLAQSHVMNWVSYWSADREATIGHATDAARRAVAADASDSRAWWQLGEIHHLTGRHDDAKVALEKALALNPNDIEAQCMYGFYLAGVGQFDAALAAFDEAKRRNPFDVLWAPWLQACAFFAAGKYDDCIACFRELSLPITEAHFWLALAQALRGAEDEARQELTRFLDKASREMAVMPALKLSAWEDYCRVISGFRDPEMIDRMLEGLRKAGMPD